MELKISELTTTTRDDKWKRVQVSLRDPDVDPSKLQSGRDWAENDGRRTRVVPRKDSPAGKTRVSVSVSGEGLWDDFENRTSRPHTLWAPIVKAALIEAGWPKTVSLRWSQKAGCSCPCSPAFFVTGGPLGLDVWATIVADTVQTADPAEAAHRRAAVNADPTLPNR